ncbi:MAG: hypothetical protein JO129_04180, partial [Candidatus Dependentiae bacterium]|nr:hypothetical protein [Candidatus Dependentiae bacterium]
ANINQSGILTSYIHLGYNKILRDFASIDYLQLFVKLGIASPQVMYENDESLFQFPLAANVTFSYPIIGIISLGVLQHLNFGLYGLILPLQPTQLPILVNPTTSNNQLLLTEAVVAKIHSKPIFSTVFYMEAHDKESRIVGTVGAGYAYGMNWTISTTNPTEFPTANINNTSLLNPWHITSIFFQLDYHVPMEGRRPHSPFYLTFFFVAPLTGSLYPKVNILGGVCSFLFSYLF